MNSKESAHLESISIEDWRRLLCSSACILASELGCFKHIIKTHQYRRSNKQNTKNNGNSKANSFLLFFNHCPVRTMKYRLHFPIVLPTLMWHKSHRATYTIYSIQNARTLNNTRTNYKFNFHLNVSTTLITFIRYTFFPCYGHSALFC